MRSACAPKWLGRMILHDELRYLGLPFVPEAVAYRPADGWLTQADTLQAVAVSSAVVARMRRRIPVGDELRAAVWRCTVAGLGRLRRDRWPHRPDEQRRDAEPLLIRRRGEGGRPHAK